MAWHNIKDYKRHKDMVFNQQCDWTHKTFSSEALPENTQQNVCTRKGKYHIYHIVGSKLCSKSIIQSDSFSITAIFFNCLFLIILYFYSFIIDVLIKEEKEKLKTIFFLFFRKLRKATILHVR